MDFSNCYLLAQQFSSRRVPSDCICCITSVTRVSFLFGQFLPIHFALSRYFVSFCRWRMYNQSLTRQQAASIGSAWHVDTTRAGCRCEWCGCCDAACRGCVGASLWGVGGGWLSWATKASPLIRELHETLRTCELCQVEKERFNLNFTLLQLTGGSLVVL